MAIRKYHKKSKIKKFRKPIQINIGMVMFGAILIYMIITIILYLTSPHITSYEVRTGSLAKDNKYTGLALREESVIDAEQSGYINYYVREGGKIAVGTPVYTVDETGQITEALKTQSEEKESLSSDELSKIQTQIEAYTNNFDPNSFHTTYDFKYDMESQILELLSQNLSENLASLQSGDGSVPNFNICYSPIDGIVSYSVDGMENVTPDTATLKMIRGKNYAKNNLRSNELVEKGSPSYKVVTSETWYLMIELDKKTADILSEEKTARVRFTKDNSTSKAEFEIMEKDNHYFAKLTFNHSMIRFATDRYVEFELIMNNTSGLKIPKSALVKKSFYKIPKEYVTKGGDNNSDGILKETATSDGNAATEFIPVNVYESTDSEVYIDKSVVKAGESIIKPDSTDRFVIGKVASLKGVYNINKGYAVFKKIDILSENADYCIIESKSDYGLTAYDHIVLDGKTVSENDIVH